MKKEHLQALNFLLKHEMSGIQSLSKLFQKDLDIVLRILTQSPGKIVVSGIGKSGHIGEKIASTLTSLGVPAIFMHPVEAMHGDLGLVSASDVLLVISHSGETAEVLKIVQILKKRGVTVIAIVGNASSTIAKLSAATLSYRINKEGSPFNLAPMASTTAALVIGDLLATALSLRAGITEQNFADMHPAGSLGLQLTKVQDVMIKGDQVPLVSDQKKFVDVLKVITEKKLGISGIHDARGKLVGVITDGDIRRFILTKDFSLHAPIKKAMTRKPQTIRERQSLHNALHHMEKYKITSLFVLDEKRHPVGVLHMHQILERQLI
jgi:arabinose-5-phosphate isomerase